ncbi:MAG TPA: penicillin-binding protein activator LpoB [Opitutaceae bacterium]|nr:penicillin-binding protein activator LpoB [Opitutaceae bacterium]
MNARTLVISAAALPAALFLGGCETTDARYVDSKGTSTIVSLDQIDIQDWNKAADEMVASLLASGVLERAPEQPAVLAISRIVNNTQQQVDTDSLTRKIRIALNQSGKTLTTTTLGLGGKAEDPLAKDAAEMQAMLGGQKKTTTLPNYTLSGKLLEDRTRAGNTRQVTYTFQLALTTIRDGLAVWEDEKQITKQGSRPSVGF